MLDVGGYYKFRDPGFQLLFCYGHTVIGQNENYAYLGLYWTWGKKKADDEKPGDPGRAAVSGHGTARPLGAEPRDANKHFQQRRLFFSPMPPSARRAAWRPYGYLSKR